MLPRDRRSASRAALLAISLAVFAVAYLRLWSFLIDDAFISVRYASNLVRGHGLVFNPGERVEGYTNFLWTVLLAVPVGLQLGLVPFLKGLSAACAVGAALATWALARTLLSRIEPGRPTVLAVLPAALFLATPAAIVSAAEGLETMLFTLLLVLATVRFLEEADRPAGWPWSAALLALLAMTRPDGAVYGVAFAAIALAQRRPLGWLARFLGTFLAPFGLYFALRAHYYGQLLPNTFYAKGGGDATLLARGWEELVHFAALGTGWFWLAAIPALFARRTRGPALVLAVVVLLRVAFQCWSGGAWMGRMRFLIPALPFLLVLGSAGLAVMLRSERARWIGAALAAVVALAPGWADYPREERREDGYGVALRAAHGALGARIAARTSRDAVVAMDDAGLAPLLADRRVVDMLGLNDAHIAHLHGRFAEKFDVGYVLARRPDLIVLISYVANPTVSEDFGLPGHAAMFQEPRFRMDYALVRDYPFALSYHLLVYRRRDSTAVPANF